MRRVLFLTFAASAIALTACPSPPKNGECKSAADCEAQAGYGKVCVQGKCAECAADTDCKAGFACAAGKCEPNPAPPVETKAEPKPECAADTECGSGKGCEAGKCIEKVDAACADPGAFTVRFGFDQSAVAGDAPATLKQLAACLQKAPARRVGVDGHADERGTTQYNLALGKKRAEAVKKYLADLGVAGTIDTNTFGKERPLCRESNEACWSKNRRAETRVSR
jgi:peptidoglycan-associated lipoprotein